MSLDVCGISECSKPLSRDGSLPKCIICNRRFHRKCSMRTNAINMDLDSNFEFTCSACRSLMFAFNNIETGDLVELFNENVFMDSILLKKSKCAGCKKYIKKNNPAAHCYYCLNYFHIKCEKLSKPDFPLPSSWCCSLCILNNLPFSKIGDENMIMTLHGMDDEYVYIYKTI